MTVQQPTLPVTMNDPIMSTQVYPTVYTTPMTSVTHSLNYTATPFVPRSTVGTTYGQTNTSVPTTSQYRQEPVSNTQDNVSALAQVLCQQASLNRLPPPEPGIFSGNPLEYNAWKTSFDLLIDKQPISTAEKLHYLRRYLGGSARECIEGFLIESSDDAYGDARRRLDQRFGDSFHVANAFRQRLSEWPRINKHDGTGLQKLSDFLRQCESAMKVNLDLRILNDCRENQAILKKLPEHLVTRWSCQIQDYRDSTGMYPPFSTFSDFIARQARLACDPITSFQALKDDKPSKSTTIKSKGTALSTETKEKEKHQRQMMTRKENVAPVFFANVTIG